MRQATKTRRRPIQITLPRGLFVLFLLYHENPGIFSPPVKPWIMEWILSLLLLVGSLLYLYRVLHESSSWRLRLWQRRR